MLILEVAFLFFPLCKMKSYFSDQKLSMVSRELGEKKSYKEPKCFQTVKRNRYISMSKNLMASTPPPFFNMESCIFGKSHVDKWARWTGSSHPSLSTSVSSKFPSWILLFSPHLSTPSLPGSDALPCSATWPSSLLQSGHLLSACFCPIDPNPFFFLFCLLFPSLSFYLLHLWQVHLSNEIYQIELPCFLKDIRGKKKTLDCKTKTPSTKAWKNKKHLKSSL